MKHRGSRRLKADCPLLTRLRIGIWLSRAVESDILIMDVEGTDSRERGDEQVQSSLVMLTSGL
jgi:hypothetical protein